MKRIWLAIASIIAIISSEPSTSDTVSTKRVQVSVTPNPPPANLNLSEANPSLCDIPSATVSSSICPHPRIAAEVSANVVPTDYKYPEGYVLRYGANTIPGKTDMTAAIRNAVNTEGLQGGGQVVLPAGRLLVSSAIVINYGKVSVVGQGWSTEIITNSPDADVFDVQQNGITLRDFTVSSSVPRTGGYYINVNGVLSYSMVSHVNMLDFYNGYGHTGIGGCDGLVFEKSYLSTKVVGGTGVNISTAKNSVNIVLDGLDIQGTSGAQPNAAIQILNVGDIELRRISTVYAGTGLLVNPRNGQTVQFLMASDSEFDSGTGEGVLLSGDGTGQIQLAKFSNIWAATNSTGFFLSGNVLRSEFVNVTGSNSTNYGLVLNTPGVRNTTVTGSAFGSNTDGIYIASGVTEFKLIGNVSGSNGQFGANRGFGLVIGGSNDVFNITENDLRNLGGIGAASITDPHRGIPGQTWFIDHNQGITTRSSGQSALSAFSTKTTISHGLADTPRIADISLTQNSSLGRAAQAWVSDVTSTTFTITTNAKPGLGVKVGWNARIWGN